MTVSGTYWNVDFKDAIAVTPFYSGASFFANPAYANSFIINPTLAQTLAFGGNLPVDGGASLASLFAGSVTPYAVLEARRANLASVKVSGIDFNLGYNRQTGFGAVNASVEGTWTLRRRSQSAPGSAFVDDLANGNTDLTLVASGGGKVGPVSGQVTVNHSNGYPILGGVNQTRIASFTSTNLFFSVDLPAWSLLSRSALTLNVDNLLDRDPPYSSLQTSGVAFTNLGRVVTVGVRKAF